MQPRLVPLCRKAMLATAALCVVLTGRSSAETVIRMATYGNTVEEWQAMANAFMATHPGIKVEVQVFSFNDYIDKITAMIAAGTPPDVFQVWAQYKPKWVEAGLLRDLTPLWERSTVLRNARIYPFMVDAARLNGRMYGVPYDYNTEVWFLNLDWMADKGVAVPDENWTVTDLRDMARKLTDPNQRVYGANNPVNWGWGDNLQWTFNWTGHEWLNDTRTDVLVDDPKNVEMLQFWYDMQWQYQVTPRPGSYGARGDFWNGGYAMWQGWLSYAFNFGPKPAYNWGLALYPKAPAAQMDFAQGHMFSIPASAKNPQEAWEFLEWMASYEGQRVIVNAAKRQPIGPYTDLWQDFFRSLGAKADYTRNWLLQVLYGKNYARNMTYWNTFPEMNQIMITHLNNIFNEHKPIGNEMAAAAREMRAILAQAATRR